MAFGTRGAGDRQALIDYVDSLDVPDSWRKKAEAVVLARTLFDPENRTARNDTERKPAAAKPSRKSAAKLGGKPVEVTEAPGG